MSTSAAVSGAEKLELLGRHVRAVGEDRTIFKHLTKRVRPMAAPVRAALRASALATLPSRGGLASLVAREPITVSVRRGTATAGVSIREGRHRRDVRSMDYGILRHPVYAKQGQRRRDSTKTGEKGWAWVQQSVPQGHWSNVIYGPVTDEFEDHVLEAVDDAIAEVVRGL